jgi:signal peptidase II
MKVLWISLFLIIADQITKILVKGSSTLGITGMPLHHSEKVWGLDWFRITFIENPGMAFGLEVAPKLFLTLFSIAAAIGILYYLWKVQDAPFSYRFSLALIFSGAVGNVIDRTFYAKVYGYGDWFYGEVVDFIHFDIWEGAVNIPFVGERYIQLFPIWNIADMAICIGVVLLFLVQNKYYEQLEAKQKNDASLEDAVSIDV